MSKEINIKRFLAKKLENLEISQMQIEAIEKGIEKNGVKKSLNMYEKKLEEQQDKEKQNRYTIDFFEQIVTILKKLNKQDV